MDAVDREDIPGMIKKETDKIPGLVNTEITNLDVPGMIRKETDKIPGLVDNAVAREDISGKVKAETDKIPGLVNGEINTQLNSDTFQNAGTSTGAIAKLESSVRAMSRYLVGKNEFEQPTDITETVDSQLQIIAKWILGDNEKQVKPIESTSTPGGTGTEHYEKYYKFSGSWNNFTTLCR